MNKKKVVKELFKRCAICDEDCYELLDAHRILPASQQGKYTFDNILPVCCNHHRAIHSGLITIVEKRLSSSGKHVLHYIDEENQHIWKVLDFFVDTL